MSNKKMADRVAKRIFMERYAEEYRAKGDLHKVIGEILSSSKGMTNAPKEFFDKVEGLFKSKLSKEGLKMDLDDPKVYPLLRRSINEVISQK